MPETLILNTRQFLEDVVNNIQNERVQRAVNIMLDIVNTDTTSNLEDPFSGTQLNSF